MNPERRREPRTILKKPVFINFGVRNGGSVSDMSAGGLGFHAIAPVPKSGTIRFWLSFESHGVDAVGEVVWTDATEKRGGLRFTVPPNEVSQILRAPEESLPIRTETSKTAPSFNSATPSLVGHRCPKCGSHSVHRSHRRGFLEPYLLRFLHLSPYRCDACYQRFYRWG
jgi:hypothetical protein